MFSQASVMLSTGGCLAEIPLGIHPLGRHPPPGRRLLQWTVRILLECILVIDVESQSPSDTKWQPREVFSMSFSEFNEAIEFSLNGTEIQ